MRDSMKPEISWDACRASHSRAKAIIVSGWSERNAMVCVNTSLMAVSVASPTGDVQENRNRSATPFAFEQQCESRARVARSAGVLLELGRYGGRIDDGVAPI